jgi:hypothetical protein
MGNTEKRRQLLRAFLIQIRYAHNLYERQVPKSPQMMIGYVPGSHHPNP